MSKPTETFGERDPARWYSERVKSYKPLVKWQVSGVESIP